jgi:hypothetical protein
MPFWTSEIDHSYPPDGQLESIGPRDFRLRTPLTYQPTDAGAVVNVVAFDPKTDDPNSDPSELGSIPKQTIRTRMSARPTLPPSRGCCGVCWEVMADNSGPRFFTTSCVPQPPRSRKAIGSLRTAIVGAPMSYSKCRCASRDIRRHQQTRRLGAKLDLLRGRLICAILGYRWLRALLTTLQVVAGVAAIYLAIPWVPRGALGPAVIARNSAHTVDHRAVS